MARTLLGERYELLDRLGAGGMAEVWRARDRRLNREVAVKVLSERLASDQPFRERFEREAMHVASLKHPNIVTVHDYGNEGATYYIVMELVEGESLQARLAATSPFMDIDLAVRLCGETLAGLAHAHGRGIVHRDIKPANILITREVTAKLADFGIARASADAGSLTTTGSFIGTPSYASPEQLSGLPSTAVTDQYSLGCVLYQCLTGRPPFEAEIPAGVMAQHLQKAPDPPQQYRPAIPRALEAVVLRALEKEPERRFDSADHMRQALVDPAAGSGDLGDDSDPTIVKPGRPLADSTGTRPRPPWRRVALIGAPIAAAALYLVVAAAAQLPPFGSGSSGRATAPTTASRQATSPQVTAPIATGFDSCLVARWTVQSTTIPITVSLSGQSVPVTGGKGATTTFTADGTLTEDFGNSAPFQGSVNGQALVVNLRGIGALRTTAGNGTLSVLQGSTAGISGTAALAGGVPTSFQGSPVTGTSFSYKCSANNLNVTSPGEQFTLTR
jgi:serine/threonine-protein kinase